MSTLLTTLATTTPLAAGWSAHVLWLRRRLHTARRDPLTGLRTREGFTRRATALLKDPRAVVVLADVDHFKQINDQYGHAAGDALLKATADRLAHYVGTSGVAGRLGGDEFFSELPRVPHAQVRGRSVLRGGTGRGCELPGC
ncbi:GGDEF domain-containing protein [Streptomyces sp. CB03238]|uniref:GGDEF domain-containing protein n=1 Tax=Streptomyces sp. CB03238 TaxID=1907777 RepID=UPI001F4EEB70|nr:GGDEF domain-containing protein [Streptomyces sp. CB03238]